MELFIKDCIKNQNVLIDNKIIIANQTGSTPGIKWIVDLLPNISYTIKIVLCKGSTDNVILYIADIYSNTILATSDLESKFIPEQRYYYIGILFQNHKLHEIIIVKFVEILKYIPDTRKMITYLADMDYANVMTEYSNMLNKYSKKYQSRVFCNMAHPFNYKLKHDINFNSVIFTEKVNNYVKDVILKSEHVIFSDELELLSNINLVNPNFIKNLDIFNSIKNLHISHPGSHYRNDYKRFNEIEYNKYKKHFYTPDLVRLNLNKSTDYEILQIYFNNINKDIIINSIENRFKEDKLIISHVPSSNQKGTDTIVKIVNRLFEDKYITENYIYQTTQHKISNEEILNIKMKSTIYIDQFIPSIGGFGVSSLESLSLGNITLAAINNVQSDNEAIKDIINITNDVEKFYQILYGILYLPRTILKAMSYKSFESYEKYITQEKQISKLEIALSE